MWMRSKGGIKGMGDSVGTMMGGQGILPTEALSHPGEPPDDRALLVCSPAHLTTSSSSNRIHEISQMCWLFPVREAFLPCPGCACAGLHGHPATHRALRDGKGRRSGDVAGITQQSFGNSRAFGSQVQELWLLWWWQQARDEGSWGAGAGAAGLVSLGSGKCVRLQCRDSASPCVCLLGVSPWRCFVWQVKVPHGGTPLPAVTRCGSRWGRWAVLFSRCLCVIVESQIGLEKT